jgi:hypothetical protein
MSNLSAIAIIDSASARQTLLRIAEEMVKQGPGFAQESVVLREAMSTLRLAPHDIESQQVLLTCWHDLFREGKLAWGYDVDNPGPPFFPFARRS